MSDLIKCPKCGKETNKFFPYCEFCSETLKGYEPKPAPKPAAGETIEDRGTAAFAELGKHSGAMKKCPFCAEEILSDAVKCRFCGEFIKKPSADENKYKVLVVSILAGAGLLLVAALIYFGAFGILKGSSGIRCDSGLSAELKSDPAKAGYVKKYVTLSDIGSTEEIDAEGAATKFLSGTVNNAGDKAIIKLTLTVHYFNKNGRCIGEGSVSPVLGTKAKPASIKPAGSKEFKIPILNVNPEWSGRIKEKVSDIELS